MLALAADPGVPLLERVKLCAIVSSNLDEFVAVRMAELRRSGRPAARTLAAATARIRELKAEQESLWLDELVPALAAERIRIVPAEACSPRELRALTKRFSREVEPLLTPIAIGPTAPFPFVLSLALNVAAIVRDEDGGGRRLVRVNVPDDLPRFLEVGDRGTRVALEDAIVHFLPDVVAGREIEAHATFRVTRDADLPVASDADDLLDEIEVGLLQRRYGDVVRLEVGGASSPEIAETLAARLELEDDQMFESRGPIGLAALHEIAALRRPRLHDRPWRPVTRRPFAAKAPSDLLARIRRRDVLVHHPYDSFDSSVAAFVAAARDAKVSALKATVYRTGNPSPTLASLVATGRRGKHAVCLVELKARFDERRNIEWARALERAGVEVVHGMPDLKVHAKLTLLVRRERGGLRRYVHIGTGNYHASNASSYEDLGLLTADDEIAADVGEVLNAVTGLTRPAVFRKLLVAPWFLREGILDEIDRVIAAARSGEQARIRIKVNGLADPAIVDALYAASDAGVDVEIVTRGICTLRPGVEGLSERIVVRSVLGRFLEHSRVLSFQAGDRVTTYLGSADLMPRNLDRRVEVMAPVDDVRLRAELALVFDTLMSDTRFSWELGPDGVWTRTTPAAGERPVSAQEALIARAARRAKKGR